MIAYLDNAATTRPYRQVVDLISDVAYNHWGNPSSSHGFGDSARQIVEDVRCQIAQDINASPDELVFTSGACEANSLAICGFERKYYTHLYVSKLEHTSINYIAKAIDGDAYIHWIDNDELGRISTKHLEQLLQQYKCESYNKILVSVLFANSEIGTMQDIKKISDITHKYNGILHIDATQAFPWSKINVQELGIDMMSVSGQKFHAGRGCGFLFVKKGIEICPIIYGSQENMRRGGTENTAAIAGMGKALELTRQHNSSEHVQRLRDGLLEQLLHIPGVKLNGPAPGAQRLVNNISLIIDGVNADQLVTLCALNDVFISKGSACQSYNPEPSATLKAIGLTDEQAFNTIRITLDEFNTEQEIDYSANIITKLVERIRNNS